MGQLDYQSIVLQARDLAITEMLTRKIVNFGGYQLNENKQPVVWQVQTLIKLATSSEAREEVGFYFIPTEDPSIALEVAKGVATFDYLNKGYPTVEVTAATPVVEETTKRKRGPNKPKAIEAATATALDDQEELPLPPVIETKTSVVEKYDNTNERHKAKLVEILNSLFPGWHKKLSKEVTKEFSSGLTGQTYTVDGLIDKSFRTKVEEFVAIQSAI